MSELSNERAQVYGTTTPDDLRYPTDYEQPADVPEVVKALADDVQAALVNKVGPDHTHEHAHAEYSPTDHTHDTSHTHTGEYAPAGHTHDTAHTHDVSGLAPVDHTHDYVTKIVAGSNVTVTPGTGTGEVTISAAGGTGGGGTVTEVTGVAPIMVSNGTTTPQINVTIGTAAGTVAAGNHTHADVPTTRKINTTAPLTGGGDLTADRTLAITTGTTAGTVATGDHTHAPQDLTAVLTADQPQPVKVAGATGTATTAARADHVHPGALLLDPVQVGTGDTPGARKLQTVNGEFRTIGQHMTFEALTPTGAAQIRFKRGGDGPGVDSWEDTTYYISSWPDQFLAFFVCDPATGASKHRPLQLLATGEAQFTTRPISGTYDAGKPAGSGNYVLFRTFADAACTLNSKLRWAWGRDATAESGANAGSNWSVWRYADDGTALTGNPLRIVRSTGVVTVQTTPAAMMRSAVTDAILRNIEEVPFEVPPDENAPEPFDGPWPDEEYRQQIGVVDEPPPVAAAAEPQVQVHLDFAQAIIDLSAEVQTTRTALSEAIGAIAALQAEVAALRGGA